MVSMIMLISTIYDREDKRMDVWYYSSSWALLSCFIKMLRHNANYQNLGVHAVKALVLALVIIYYSMINIGKDPPPPNPFDS